MNATTWIAVVVAGGLGAVARLLVDELVRGRWSHGFPAGIFVVNVTGALLIGLAAGALTGHTLTIVTTGFLGGYTTFSTWMLDSYNALARREAWIASANVIVSLAVGLAAVHLGSGLG